MGFSKRHSLLVIVVALLYQGLRLSTNDYSLPKENQNFTDFAPPSGQFVNLSHGEVHYLLEGDPDGQLVVLIHGLFSEGNDLRSLLPHLPPSKYRFLSFDLYGMGHSSAPSNVRFDERLYVGQLAELLFKLQLTQPAIFVGHSLGGAIAAVFATKFPASVKGLVLVVPAGLIANVPIYAQFYIPFLTDTLARLLGPTMIPKRVPDGFPNPEAFRDTIEKIQARRAYFFKYNPDYISSVFLCIQQFPITKLVPHFESLSHFDFPIHAVWAVEDETTPIEGASLLKSLVPNVQLTMIDHVGHFVFHEAPQAVAQVVLNLN